jgi:hypothetical protein
LEVFEAHSIEECDGKASTRQIAKALDEPVKAMAARLRGMQLRGLCLSHWCSWDDTVDWTLTGIGVEEAEAGREALAGVKE